MSQETNTTNTTNAAREAGQKVIGNCVSEAEIEDGMEMEDDAFYFQNDPGYRECNCEDYPCCGH